MALRENLEFVRKGPGQAAEEAARMNQAGRPIQNSRPVKSEFFVSGPGLTSGGLSWPAFKIRPWIT